MQFAALINDIRSQFPALARTVNGYPAAFFDGPGGTQVPQVVIDAVSDYYSRCNANHGGVFATSAESDDILDEAHRAVANFLGADDPDTVMFGANMTSLTFAFSRALSRTWRRGDEVIVSRLDHDANFTPWVMAAQDAGATVRHIDLHREDCTLDLDTFREALSERTKLVAVGCASNAVGTINPVREICRLSREVGALTFLDAVHYAPHALIDVDDFGCDFLACSAYKFFGPHIGILWGKREHLQSLSAYKVRPAPNSLPGKWMTGTQNHEGIAGTLAAVDYLAGLGRTVSGNSNLTRREALALSMNAIQQYESDLIWKLIDGLKDIPSVRIFGITDSTRAAERLPTVSITHAKLSPESLAVQLGAKGFFVWHGNFYAQPLTEALGLEPDGMVRIGLAHYNTTMEVGRLIETLQKLD
ncbi:MAG: cysteine desulfurase-like protein [Planctomycetaceae bacterium]